jgi:hypothetical protein
MHPEGKGYKEDEAENQESDCLRGADAGQVGADDAEGLLG